MVSIIICTRDLDDWKLRQCKFSIKSQTYRDIELIIVSGGYIADARRRGVEKAQGEFICFVDSDQVLPPTLIQNCIESGFDGVTWLERALNPATFCEKVIDYDKKLFHEDNDDHPIYGAAEPRFFKAEFVKRIDWSKLPPVTFELSMINKQIKDMGCRSGWVNSVVYHHEPHTFRELAKKFFRYGYYYIPSLKFSKELVLNHSKPRRAYFKLKALKRPVLYLGLWFHYFIKAGSAFGGAIWYLIKKRGQNEKNISSI